MGLALIQVAHFQSEPAEQGVGFQRIRIAGQNALQMVLSGSSRRRRWLDLGQQESGLPKVSGDVAVAVADRGDSREQCRGPLLFAECPAAPGQRVEEFGAAVFLCQPLKTQSGGPVVASRKGPFRPSLVRGHHCRREFLLGRGQDGKSDRAADQSR